MNDPIPPQFQLEQTYNAAADHYDHPALSFWDRFGKRTVERLSLVQGMGSGYRSTVEALSPPARERVRVATIEAVKRERIAKIRTDVSYGNARRPKAAYRRIGVGA